VKTFLFWKRRLFLFGFLAMLFVLPLFAAFEEKPFSARSAALGESLVGSVLGLDAPHDNPGALVFVDRSGVSLGHTQLYGDADLPSNALSGVFSTKRRGAFGFFVTDFGSELYREKEIGMAWGGRIGDRASLGATVKRQEVEIERYGRLSAYQVDVGLFGRPHPKVGAGVCVKNLTQSHLGGTPESPPALFNAGISLNAFARGPTSLAVVSESGGKVSWRAGQEAWFHPAFALRAGFETDPNRFGLGMGIRFSAFALDYAFLTHPLLSDQHSFNFSYFP
jgi:hypothetical protein